tara:strand:+ start:23096 stop:23341 length:246 start_codon:yes stop_codon:yes gene_type:complete
MNTNRIIIALSSAELNLKLMCNTGDDKSDIYKMHREFTGNLTSMLPTDEYYVMNNDGDIEFIGNLACLGNFCNKLTYVMER